MSSEPATASRPTASRPSWGIAVLLAAIALVRPALSIVGAQDALGRPLTPILLTVGISLAWVAILGFTRVRRPLLTGVLAGLIYAVVALVGSSVLSPVLTGELQGPLATPVPPIAVLAVLFTNAAWGAVCGLVAWGIQRARGVRGLP